MKKVISMILALVLVLSFLMITPFSAYTVEEDEVKKHLSTDDPNSKPDELAGTAADSEIITTVKIFGNYAYNVLDDGTVEIFLYLGSEDRVTIPSTLEGKTVTSISEDAFAYCEDVTSITIPNSVKSIGNHAFHGCSNLSSITIPDSVISIGGNAFEDTAWLNNQPDGVIYAGKVLYKVKGSYPTKIEVKDGTLTIADYAFSPCFEMTTVTIPASVKYIGRDVFGTCFELTSISVNSSNQAFCSVDGNLYNKSKSTLIRYAGGKTATSFSIPDTVKTIGDHAFETCNYLTSVTIPTSVTSIGYAAFWYCYSLSSINIPSSVTYIDDLAFSNCKALSTINIPASVTTIEESAFQDTNLTSITVDSANPSFCSVDGSLYDKSKTTLLLYAIGKTASSFSVPTNVKTIGPFAFANCRSLTSVTIPESVKSIGHYAFLSCHNLASVTIPDSVTSVGINAFESTAWYDNQPDGLVYAGKNAYSIKGSCPSKVAIKDGTISLTEELFNYCSSLTSVIIPDSVKSIGKYAFSHCQNLIGVKIPDSVETIEACTFSWCLNLKSVMIPDSVTKIDRFAFFGCDLLNSITIPKSVISIGKMAFGYAGVLEVAKVDGFTISGYNNTAAERYADDNGFIFVPLGVGPVILGDADGNGEIESVDATCILRYVADIPTPYTKEELMRGDVDGDGDLTTMDATAIQYYLANLKTNFPIGQTVT